jgi:hypothetical protein
MSGFLLGLGGQSDQILGLTNTSTDGGSNQLISQSKINTDPDGVIGGQDGAYGNVIRTLGSESLFNPFSVFRYSEFGRGSTAFAHNSYQLDRHKNTYINADLLTE